MQPFRRLRNPVDREACPGHKTLIGAWRSLVAHLPGGQGVAGSNPVAPTKCTFVRLARHVRPGDMAFKVELRYRPSRTPVPTAMAANY